MMMMRQVVAVAVLALAVAAVDAAAVAAKKTTNPAAVNSFDKTLTPPDVTGAQSEFVEVAEEDIPEGALVYVMDVATESPLTSRHRAEDESLSTADNIVFRPLFNYRAKQAEIAKRRVANGYRRRYFIQRRPDRNSYYQYYPNYPYRYGY